MSFILDNLPGVSVRREVRRAAAPGHHMPAMRRGDFAGVDVAIVMESTYPYLKGGVSAVVHDIILGNPDLDFGIIHIAWGRNSPHEDLYGMPDNVKWVHPRYLAMTEHRDTFLAAKVSDMGVDSDTRRAISEHLWNALEAIPRGDTRLFWEFYDDYISPGIRRTPFWPLLGSQEFMDVTTSRADYLGMPLAESFWLLRDFFSLTYGVLTDPFPPARVYHAHTTGYASMLAAAAAREHGTSFFLTEHNLYVRDTINTLLDRDMSLVVKAEDYRDPEMGSATQRAWMAWWIEMGRLCYPSADLISYLYPNAIAEAEGLGSPVNRAVVVPNGMTMSQFDDVYEQRRAARAQQPIGRPRHLAYIARVVPIKGLLDLIDTVQLLNERGMDDFVVDVCGPTDHTPWYYERCVAKVAQLGLSDRIIFHGTVNVRAMLGVFDVLVMPSYNEGQPIVVLEAMTAGIPTVGTNVGGMQQLVHDDLITASGNVWGPCGLLTTPGDAEEMADKVERVLSDTNLYEELAFNARQRVRSTFQLHDVTSTYNSIYRTLGGLPSRSDELAAHLMDSATATDTGGLPVTDGHSKWVIDVRDHILRKVATTSRGQGDNA